MAAPRVPHMKFVSARAQLPRLHLHALHYREAGQDWRVDEHVHPWWQWYCVLTGEAPISVDGRNHHCSVEEWLLIPPGRVRAIEDVEPATGYLVALFSLESIDPSPIALAVQPMPDPLREDLHALIDELRSQSGDPLSDALRATLVTRLLLGLLRLGARAPADAPAPAGAPRREDLAARAEAWMAGHLQHRIERADMAAAMGLSPPHFARLFRAATGETPLQRLSKLRIERARALLLETDRPITAIAGDVGFSSFSHFNLVFRQSVGCNPSDFRRLRGRVWS